MTDIFDGDPYIIITEDGADFEFKGGQPVMDQGFENHVNISLLTKPGWCGNDIEPVNERKIGSNFLTDAKKPITRQSLLDLDKTAVLAVSGDEFEKVTSETINPYSQQLRTEIIYTPVSRNPEKLSLTKNGLNWLSQKNNPAHGQI